MASKTTVSANDFLNYAFRNVAPSWGGATTLYLAAHSAAVGLGGDQQTNEIAYTGYSRYALTRNSSGNFDAAAAGQLANNILIQFGNPTAGSFPIVVTHLSIGPNGSGASTAIVTGALASARTINLGIQLQLAINSLVIQEQ